jgi:hypothetical protein
MIRWRYKTLHFELKKDGILGGAFLDETELEERLCRYGRDGWELVTVLDVEDGLVALCKQPLPEAQASEGEQTPAPKKAALTIVAKTSAKPPVIKPPEPAERSPSLFGEPDEEDAASVDGPQIDADAGDDDEKDGFTSIRIE